MKPNTQILDARDSLEQWVSCASSGLSSKSRDFVRAEIQEHYELALEDELFKGAGAGEAARQALVSLGDPAEVNRGYREALLTAREARALCAARWETGMARRHPALKSAPLLLSLASTVLYLAGEWRLALIAASIGVPFLMFYAAQYLPLHNRRRAQIFRVLKYVALLAMYVTVYPLENSTWASLLIFAVTWAPREWSRASLRRKLPESEWPETLYN